MRTRFSALLLLPTVSFALYAPKGSPCAVECATKSANFTGTGDLVCQDTAYSDDSKGITLKSCISCLSKSDYVNSSSPTNGNSDQWWYLCTLRAADVGAWLTINRAYQVCPTILPHRHASDDRGLQLRIEVRPNERCVRCILDISRCSSSICLLWMELLSIH